LLVTLPELLLLDHTLPKLLLLEHTLLKLLLLDHTLLKLPDLSHSQDKIWEWPGDEALQIFRQEVANRTCLQGMHREN